ncbi:MAG: hypothetical protein HQ568_11565 [Calditrichaeota bacterium]|nr:hypothetical protein [Calditrichota bacterium]
MKTYRVTLTRSYFVEVKAENEEMARGVSEFFMGHIADESTAKDQDEYNFSFGEIEMVENEVFDAIEVFE